MAAPVAPTGASWWHAVTDPQEKRLMQSASHTDDWNLWLKEGDVVPGAFLTIAAGDMVWHDTDDRSRVLSVEDLLRAKGWL
jgi:hypothetical protein